MLMNVWEESWTIYKSYFNMLSTFSHMGIATEGAIMLFAFVLALEVTSFREKLR